MMALPFTPLTLLYWNFMPSDLRQIVVKAATIMVLVTMIICTGFGCRELPAESDSMSTEYSILVAGHTYGEPEVHHDGLYPPFIAALDSLRTRPFAFGILTGDIVIHANETTWDRVDAQLSKFPWPFQFAVGNHDMGDRDLYISRYGPTWHSFRHHDDLIMILDSEVDSCSITGDQLDHLSEELDRGDFQRVFLFVHRLIWIQKETPWLALRKGLNSARGYDFRNNFWPEIEPLLRAVDVPVYLFAGDVGVVWAMPLFMQQEGNITFVASGMGGHPEENYLEISVTPDSVSITAIRLDGQPLQRGSIDAYDLQYYRSMKNSSSK